MSSAALTGAPDSMRLSGVEYLISPLGDQDISMLDEYVRAQFMATAVAAARAAGEDTKIGQMIITSAVAQAPQISFMTNAGAALIKSVDGVSRILWQGARHNHPGLSHEALRKAMFNNKEAIAEANAIFKRLNIDPLGTLVPANGKKVPAAAVRSRKKSYTPTSARSTKSRRKK